MPVIALFLILTLFILFGTVAGLVLLYFNSRRAAIARGGAGEPACGKCGYPARGISTFECPECGADLREVGIVTPGQGAVVGSGCVLPAAFSIVVLVFSGIMLPFIHSQLPVVHDQSHDFDLTPYITQNYTATILLAVRERNSSRHHAGHGSFSASSSSSYSSVNNTRTQTTTLMGLPVNNPVKPTIRLDHLSLSIQVPGRPQPSPLEIDPSTKQANWATASGQLRQGSAPLRQQDVLDYFADAGLNVADPDTQAQAAELFTALHALAHLNASSVTFTQLDSNGSGSSSSTRTEPTWFTPAYILTWLVLWIVGLVVIARRGRRARSGETPAA